MALVTHNISSNFVVFFVYSYLVWLADITAYGCLMHDFEIDWMHTEYRERYRRAMLASASMTMMMIFGCEMSIELL